MGDLEFLRTLSNLHVESAGARTKDGRVTELVFHTQGDTKWTLTPVLYEEGDGEVTPHLLVKTNDVKE